MGYIAVDFDGTLAHHVNGQKSLGKPIEPMLKRVKAWLEAGEEVRILTARAAGPRVRGVPTLDHEDVARIQEWCQEHVGAVLRVQFWKDYGMIELWDDRAIGVIPNTGMKRGNG